MKAVFNFISTTAVAVAILASSGADAGAERTYFTTRSVLKAFFPSSDKVGYERFTPTPAQRHELRKRLGYNPPSNSYVFYIATRRDHIDGYALIDQEMGQHQPITFAIKLSPAGVVERSEIMVYREHHGDEIRAARFRDQFRGKSCDDPVTANVDIAAVSGATISSHSMAAGVRRALALFDVAYGTRSHVSAARPGPARD